MADVVDRLSSGLFNCRHTDSQEPLAILANFSNLIETLSFVLASFVVTFIYLADLYQYLAHSLSSC